jgi:hypothetical protein
VNIGRVDEGERVVIKIRNQRTGAVIADRATEAATHWSRFRGLIGRRSLESGGGLVIRPSSSIHMLFMMFTIDTVFFDADDRVTSASSNVRPWIGFASGGGSAVGVIELPRGAAAEVEPGDQLQFLDGSPAVSSDEPAAAES